ncbi:MAG: nucleotidyl transferase AbiEii/AbiGii toxin family protein [bacterium]|nr:nucleotidyl transferase AbiEii/AbiGii toxin family protein [bacterium]
MGNISILTKNQKILLDLITNNIYFSSKYYFTGGTALNEFYLHHRYSDDLDFFSNDKVDIQAVFELIERWSKKLHFRFTSRFAEVVYRFNITFPNNENIKIDFGHYPYPIIEKSNIKYKKMMINSLRDIGSNKIITIIQRTDVKDFVDLYFLLRENYTIWDLIYSAQEKFRQMDIDIMLLAEDLLKVEDFTTLPRMIKPLKLSQLKAFFRKEAIILGSKAVE